jgi:sugar (pentulose or hexulose) kinase
MGLWLVQECRREWMRAGEEISFDALTQLAAESEAFVAVIDPDVDDFIHPGDMPGRIRKFCADSNQRMPQTKGQIIRIILESIALKYRLVLERLQELTGKRFDPVHIIGGGTKNKLLNQFAADATERTVIAGPAEATAIGNILMQSIGMNHLGGLADAREIVRASFEPEIYEPTHNADWDEAYSRIKNSSNDFNRSAKRD